MFQRLKNILIGEPLTHDDNGDEHLLSKIQALAMLSSDALSSIAYGPEQVVLVLTAVSSAAIWWSIPIGLLVLVLLASLTISYRQVIKAYPQGGGAYMVTTENLSPKFGLIAGGSLLVDYMLTVAVSVASGADAITSALPFLHPFNLEISMILVLVLMVMNLRGMRESAKSLMIPVYLFIVSTLFLLGFGFFQILTGHMPYAATAHLGQPITGVSLILILRAFTSGSASLTGVEAISNAVPFFKKPKAKNAASTLFIMSSILGAMFAGITFLNWWTGITPHAGVTILSQMAREILGQSWIGSILFYVFQFSTAMILAVAANTGFSAFPMLSFNMAKNKYMPHMYLEKGARMGYSNGILTLAIGAITVIVGVLNYYGEKIISYFETIGTVLLYIGYISFSVLVISHGGAHISEVMASGDHSFVPDATVGAALWTGILYMAYNLVVFPASFFTIKAQKSRKDTIISGIIAGLLMIIPWFMTYYAVMAFYPDKAVLASPVPWVAMMQADNAPGWLLLLFSIVMGWTLIETATGIIHAMLERVDKGLTDTGRNPLTRQHRGALTVIILVISVAFAKIGIIDLIAKGYNALAYAFILLYLVPLLTVGVYKIMKKSSGKEETKVIPAEIAK